MSIFDSVSISSRQEKLSSVLTKVMKKNEVLLIDCGQPIRKPGGLDQHYPFLPHPEYFWLTGSRRPEGIMAFTPSEGWVHFVKPISAMEMLWEGAIGRVDGVDIEKFGHWINLHSAHHEFCLLGQGEFQLLPVVNVVDDQRRIELQETVNAVRRPKDEAELQLMKNCAAAAAKGYSLLQKIIRPGITERQIQIEYEAEVLRAGSEKMPYDTIVGAGSNAAILHAMPTARILQDQEFLLIDAGADIQDYCVDITRVFCTSGQFSTQQQAIYNIVKQAQKLAIDTCRVGVAWATVHETAARVMTQGLVDIGIMRGNVEELMQQGAIAMFFPHGVGHMVGQRVRDVGGNPLIGETFSCGARLRVNITLDENYVMTVEPGLYFVKSILSDIGNRKKFKEQINWTEVDKWMDIGGVRLEDDIVIKQNTVENITDFIEK